MKLSTIATTLKSVFGEKEANALGLATGQSKRLRKVTPARLALALVGALAGGTVASIADLLREFNFMHGTTVAYKAFYNRLSHKGFPEFMRYMVSCMMKEFVMRTLKPEPDGPLAQLKDIIIQDGTSFAVKENLKEVFPGRFNTVDPAAVELHVTYSGLEDQAVAAVVTADKDGERQFLPKADELENILILGDRGFPSLPYFRAVEKSGGFFIMRLSRSWMPHVLSVHTRKGVHALRKPVPLKTFLAQNPNRAFDLEASFNDKKERTIFRLIIIPGKDPSMTRLCTNLPRDLFSIDIISKLYRFRWQIEICFKEWKSHANLHAFDTGNRYIAEGLIWASLCAAMLKRFIAHATQAVNGISISTLRVATCAKVFIRELLMAIDSPSRLLFYISLTIDYLTKNATRANPKRDIEKGRQNAGLALVGVALSDHL
jgi:hypothetical protein